MSPDKDKKLEDEAQEPEDEEEDAAEDAGDELLDEGAAAPPARGGSGALVGIIVIFIVVVVVVLLWQYKRAAEQKRQDELDTRRQAMGTQLTTIQDNVREAQRKLDGDTLDVEAAIGALNRAAGQLGDVALSAGDFDEDTAGQLVDLQRQVQQAARALGDHNDQYQASVQAARKTLKKAAMDEVGPLAGKIQNLATATFGDVDTPIRTAPSMTTEDEEEPAGETAAPQDEATEQEPAQGASGEATDQPAAGADAAQPTDDKQTPSAAGASEKE